MEALKEKKNIHHGNNVRLARTWKKVTQDDLADRLNMYQSEVSKLENQEEIDDQLLDKISNALSVPVDFFKAFDPEAAIYNFTFNNQPDAVKVIAEENSKDAVQQGQGELNITYNYPLDDLKELYERLLQEKDRQIEELRAKLK